MDDTKAASEVSRTEKKRTPFPAFFSQQATSAGWHGTLGGSFIIRQIRRTSAERRERQSNNPESDDWDDTALLEASVGLGIFDRVCIGRRLGGHSKRLTDQQSYIRYVPFDAFTAVYPTMYLRVPARL